MDLLRRLFSTSEFMPHGMCYRWNPAVIWLYVISDAVIALAYTRFVDALRQLGVFWAVINMPPPAAAISRQA
jgi:hypothetical protein